MMEIRDIFANELPTATYFCATAVMLAVYVLFALSLNRRARSPACATRQAFSDLRRRRLKQRDLGTCDIIFWKVADSLEQTRPFSVVEIPAR